MSHPSVCEVLSHSQVCDSARREDPLPTHEEEEEQGQYLVHTRSNNTTNRGVFKLGLRPAARLASGLFGSP